MSEKKSHLDDFISLIDSGGSVCELDCDKCILYFSDKSKPPLIVKNVSFNSLLPGLIKTIKFDCYDFERNNQTCNRSHISWMILVHGVNETFVYFDFDKRQWEIVTDHDPFIPSKQE